MVLRSVELSRAMVLWHGREGISEAAGEHSGRQFESCIKFMTTTTLPFEIEINSLHLHQPIIQRVISTQISTLNTNQQSTSFTLIFNGVPTSIHSGINTPNVLPTQVFSFCTKSGARELQRFVSFGAMWYTIFRVGKTYILHEQ